MARKSIIPTYRECVKEGLKVTYELFKQQVIDFSEFLSKHLHDRYGDCIHMKEPRILKNGKAVLYLSIQTAQSKKQSFQAIISRDGVAFQDRPNGNYCSRPVTNKKRLLKNVKMYVDSCIPEPE